MSSQGPISVSAPGNSLIGATSRDITFSTRYPFHKLDSTNPNSFEIITIFFNREPPDPVMPTPGGSTTTSNTLVYSFPHGYSYVPSTWFLVSIDNFQTTKGSEGAIIEIAPSSGIAQTYARLGITVDKENVNFYIYKQWWARAGIVDPNPPHIIGFSVSIRSYIFVNDLLGGDVPNQP
jgi:hypothetical protein